MDLASAHRRPAQRSIGKHIAAIAVIVVLPILLIQFSLWCWRPLFYNEWVMHDGVPFFHWWPQAPRFDARGNVAVADYRRNVLCVFLTANSQIDRSRFSFPHREHGGMAFPDPTDLSGCDFFVAECCDKLLVFDSTGKHAEFPLARGEAERIHEVMGMYPQPRNFIQLLEHMYTPSHPKETERLQKALSQMAFRKR